MTDRLVAIEIDDTGLPAPTPEMAQERRVAIVDLLEENRFALPPHPDRGTTGPWRLNLSVRERRLVFAVTAESGEPAGEFHMSMGPFRQVVKDYSQICQSYYDAVRTLPPSQIETIDMARRGIHNEGARVLQERLAGKAELDQDTARRLFTLICVLQLGG
ncbi:UPF0262 family protein [Rubellimicrobium aerolatum]|uniref:UPF0262 protein ACFPOC_18155 n=1 Tax=Rubellimicrobium aerolatum TaxID=490979 RepID=A0ABW0SH75_9RHOB|nr:UPF0262 family protein [Rubellimicrobium aerolatum]MBP1807690.1 uncharacterized protein (UPF0262 family) [Rubellimicrobium aerolatum]